MKKILVALALTSPLILALGFDTPIGSDALNIPMTPQRTGDSAAGYNYLITGDYVSSGAPYGAYLLANGKSETNYLNRTGKNATISYGYNMVMREGVELVAPTCLQCHAHVFEGQLVVGLGNTTVDFSDAGNNNYERKLKFLQLTAPRQYAAAKPFFTSFITVFPQIETEVQGVNTADKLAVALVAHRNSKTLEWIDTATMPVPTEVIPTDVPAWWLMKKKNAMFYNGFGRGDMTKFMMLSNLLTVTDTAEARRVSDHFGDVLAYVRSLNPPKYPLAIDEKTAEQGRVIFNSNCSSCHGTYGSTGSYPNLLVPVSVIRTDSVLCMAVQQNQQFIDWFNNSWFVQGENPAHLQPFNGYIAPPLDGVWITAPYLHNASVPNLEAVLNSKLRPRYWSRDFDKPEYDYTSIGWKYTTHQEPIKKKTYNTDLPGYGNHGHYFGDGLSDNERKAVIEYLKTL